MTDYRHIGRTMVRALDPRITARVRAERERLEILSARLRPGTIAVVGPGSGTGRSTVAALVTSALARHQGGGVLAVDTGRGGGLHARLATRPAGSTEAVLTGLGLRGATAGRRPAVGQRWLREHLALAERAMLLAGPPGGAGSPVTAAEYGTVSATLSRWFPVRVVDTPPLTGDPVVPAVLTRADRVVLVAPSDDRGLRWLADCRLWIVPLLREPFERVGVQVLVHRDAQPPAAAARLSPGESGDVPTFVLPFDPALRAAGALRWADLSARTEEIILDIAAQIVRDMRLR
ncbi:hypothetical protein JNW91_20385 [Micromonospora sp. STR1_7]|uniref:MinD-like ATPase involved in chromosome partitioning or flagellar assembly n=1 Tax=Micromonospora parastrephiae TaxID=2806101 RepID=A0ABS1XXK1_9ACTN|nr:hypothetical protein [Micromonospora parastrephiae]MBM0233996.1 hypothetical protein [Micromonospora parastrephiae]